MDIISQLFTIIDKTIKYCNDISEEINKHIYLNISTEARSKMLQEKISEYLNKVNNDLKSISDSFYITFDLKIDESDITVSIKSSGLLQELIDIRLNNKTILYRNNISLDRLLFILDSINRRIIKRIYLVDTGNYYLLKIGSIIYIINILQVPVLDFVKILRNELVEYYKL